MKKYHFGIVKKSEKTAILQMRKTVDELSCELWLYFGERMNTKAQIRKDKVKLLQEINNSYSKNFKHLIIQ